MSVLKNKQQRLNEIITELINRVPFKKYPWSQEINLFQSQGNIQWIDEDLPSLLDSTLFPQVFWLDSHSNTQYLGLGGNYFKREYFEKLQNSWNEKPPCLFFINSFFQSQSTLGHLTSTNEWSAFSESEIILPFLLFQRKKEGMILTINHLSATTQEIGKEEINIVLQTINQHLSLKGLEHISIPSQHSSSLMLPSHNQWVSSVEKCIKEIQTSTLQKIVLARKFIITYASDFKIDPVAFLHKLILQNEDSLLFYLSPQKGIAFMGRSPERLFRLKGDKIYSEAIAGTRPRGKTDIEDENFANELLHSEKEKKEHTIVADFVKKILQSFCQHLEMKKKLMPLKLLRLQHLHTTFEGILRPDKNLFDVLTALHPTPAVGGLPQKRAIDIIREEELFFRGCYAAPFGWYDGENADFLVGIRSALVHQQDLHLFAGAGIVSESKAEEEWLETQSKLDNFLQML